MSLAARQLTRAEEEALLGVSPADYAPPEGGLLQNTGDEFLTALHAWLREHHVDDWDCRGHTLLWHAAWGRVYAEFCAPPEHWVQLARDLLARGANPKCCSLLDDTTALINACIGAAPLEMVPLLVDAGADVRAMARYLGLGQTALSFTLKNEESQETDEGLSTRDRVKIVHVLLRAGAPLDACYGDESAEEVLREQERKRPAYAADPHFAELKRVFRGVRAAKGSYARYAKKEVLVLLALVRKGRAATTWFYAGDHRTAFDILAKSPNEIAWHVLAFSFGMSVGSAGADGYYDSRPPRTPTLNVEDDSEEEFNFDANIEDDPW